MQEFVFYKRHIFLLFFFFLVHNVSLNGAWRGFVPEGGGLEEFWGGDVPLEPLAYTRPGADQTNFQFFFTYHLSFYYSFIWLSVSFNVWFQLNYFFVHSFTYLITCDQVSFLPFWETKNKRLIAGYLFNYFVICLNFNNM